MPRKSRSQDVDRPLERETSRPLPPEAAAAMTGRDVAPAPPPLASAPPDIQQFGSALARIEQGKIKAISDGDRVVIMIQDAPEQLRRLASALERINVTEIQALVAYMKPEPSREKHPPRLQGQ